LKHFYYLINTKEFTYYITKHYTLLLFIGKNVFSFFTFMSNLNENKILNTEEKLRQNNINNNK